MMKTSEKVFAVASLFALGLAFNSLLPTTRVKVGDLFYAYSGWALVGYLFQRKS